MKDEIYAFDFDVLVSALYIAANDAFEDEIIDTEMLPLELEHLPGVSVEQYKEDWIESRVEDWIMRGLELE